MTVLPLRTPPTLGRRAHEKFIGARRSVATYFLCPLSPMICLRFQIIHSVMGADTDQRVLTDVRVPISDLEESLVDETDDGGQAAGANA